MPADPVDFPEPRAADEGIPLSRREPQDRPLRAPAVANPDLPSGQVRCLDAVAVGEAEGTLDPSRAHLLTHRHLPAVYGTNVRLIQVMSIIFENLSD
jgi:hypothetical protein